MSICFVVHELGTLPYRIVIRDLSDHFVVHTAIYQPDKKTWFHQGNGWVPRLVVALGRLVRARC